MYVKNNIELNNVCKINEDELYMITKIVLLRVLNTNTQTKN